MSKLALIALILAACGKPKHLPECDTFQKTVDKLSQCKSLPDTAKAEIAKADKQLKGMFDMIDQAGGIEKAPQDVQDNLKDTCKSQNSTIIDAYQKVAPDCLK